MLPTLSFFGPKEANILAHLTRSMVGLDNLETLEVPMTDVLATIDAFVLKLAPTVRTQLRQGLHLFQWCPILFIGKLRPFTRLSPHDAEAYIRTWAESPIGLRRRIFRGLRDVAFLGYYSHLGS